MQQFCQSVFTFGRSHFLELIFSLLFFSLVVQYETVSRIFYPKPFICNCSQVLTDESILSRSNKNDFLIAINSTDTAVQPVILPTVENKELELPQCPMVPPKLVGALKVLTDSPSFGDLEKMFPDLEPGGRFSPKGCTSRKRLALIVPFRNREEQLHIFLHNLHPFLMRQQLDYRIFVVEQFGNATFNKGLLMNIGYLEALKRYDYQCFIFHDVDAIPEDDRNLYACHQQPRHMAVGMDCFQYRLPYPFFFGGVVALTREHMEKVNGFSNEYLGWGGEDDDMSYRVTDHGYNISRYPADLARYKMTKHKKETPNPDALKILYEASKRYKIDGLANLKYKLLHLVPKKLYTWMLVDIGSFINYTSEWNKNKKP